MAGREIWIFGDLRNVRLLGVSFNVVAMARQLVSKTSGKVAVVLMGSSDPQTCDASEPKRDSVFMTDAVEQCICQGADRVYLLDHAHLAVPRTDVYAPLLAKTVREHNPLLMLFALTDFGRELAARVAGINAAGLISDCAGLRIDAGRVVAKCPSWGGQIMADITFAEDPGTGFATVQPHAVQAVAVRGKPGDVVRLPVEDLHVPGEIRLISSTPCPQTRCSLENAPVVVVGGAGLSNTEGFGLVRELAAALGGEVGATRPPVLQHWVENDRLIGQTGKSVRPNLLLSVATSGAVQYTAGISEAKTIVAINRDRNAPIFEIADIGIVADARSFLPMFTAGVKRVVMRNLADVLGDRETIRSKDGFGAKVQKLREAHGWSLETLAQTTGHTPEFISQVESDQVAPSVSFLLRLANALDVDPGTFLHDEEKARIRDQRAQAFIKRTQNYSYQTLTLGAASDHLRAFMITIEPRQLHKPVEYKHAGEEFIFVMEGDLELTLDGKAHNLKAGESIHFNSDLHHKLKSLSNEPTRCLVVLYTE
jgi:electron transfer flavoprotein alpha subunit/transcriptional regulator with XRE-family HTH domain